MEPKLATTSEELRNSLLTFNAGLTSRDVASVLHKDGSKTMGGLTQASTNFNQVTSLIFADLPKDCRGVAAGAVSLASSIVQGHNFHDGNGRTSMWVLYFWMANFHFKFAVKPAYLHGYLFSETEKDDIPDGLIEVVLAFSSPATSSQVKSHLKHMRSQLEELETVRKLVREKAKKFGAMAFQNRPLNPAGLVGTVAARNLWTDYRPAMQEISKFIQSYKSPVSAFTAATWMSKIIQEFGDDKRTVKIEDVRNWLDNNIKPGLQY